MAIWRTRPPNPSDFPIWAYTLKDTGALDKLRLYESLEDLMVGDSMMVWATVQAPLPPVDSTSQDVIDEFQRLAGSPDTAEWSSSDWFIAGYNQAMSPRVHDINESEEGQGNCGCGGGGCGCGCSN